MLSSDISFVNDLSNDVRADMKTMVFDATGFFFGWWDHCISLVNYRRTHAKQPPNSSVLTRHSLPTSVSVWSL